MRVLKKTLVLTVLLLLLAPATILTTVFVSTPSDYVRVQADDCFTAYLSSYTIPEGTPSITVAGMDTCDPPNTQIGVAIARWELLWHAYWSGPV